MDAIPPAVSPKPPTQILIPKPGMAEDQKSAQDADAKYQEIFYCKRRIWEKGPRDPNELKPIDLRAALDETLSLSNADPDMKSNAYSYIVFYNQQNLNSVDILRLGRTCGSSKLLCFVRTYTAITPTMHSPTPNGL